MPRLGPSSRWASHVSTHAPSLPGPACLSLQSRTDFQTCDMEVLVKKMDVEFAYYNLTLCELVDEGKEVHWIEWGVGGGASQNGDTPAKTGQEAAYYPYWARHYPVL